MKIKTYEDLAEVVQASGNLFACKMETLREIHEAGRLGVNVVAGIQDKLAQHGLGHVPVDLPTYQHLEVRIYKRGTPVGVIIEAVLEPSENGDERIRDAAGADAAERLQKVREIVCD